MSNMKTVIVTGATSGIGLAVCREMSKQGYRVVGVGRSEDKCESSCGMLSQEFPNGEAAFFCADLMQLSEVKKVAEELSSYLEGHCEGKLYALINNAGCVRSWYSTTEDGYEQQFAVNHLAGFLLTHYMLPYLRNDNGRVIMTSSNSHKMMRMRWNDIMFQRGYNPLMVYKQSKLCNMLFAYGFNEKYAQNGMRAYGIDPGLVATDIGLKQTGGLVRLVWGARMKGGLPPEVPARTYAWVCGQDIAPGGLYYCLCKEKRHSSQVNRENADRLFKLSEKLCGINFGRYES